jgi:hypothetical protein
MVLLLLLLAALSSGTPPLLLLVFLRSTAKKLLRSRSCCRCSLAPAEPTPPVSLHCWLAFTTAAALPAVGGTTAVLPATAAAAGDRTGDASPAAAAECVSLLTGLVRESTT